MSHVYVVATNTAIGDAATLTGSVDGVPVTVSYWVSHVQGLPLAQAKTYVAGLMYAAAFPAAPAPVTQLPVGTFTQ